jgi:hypothetical protein
MPRRHDRAGALRKAKILLDAAEMLKHLSRKVGGAGRITAEI